MLSRASLLIAFAALVACGSSGGGIEDQIADLETLFAAEADTECACFSELGYASEAECTSENYQPLSATEQQCLLDAYQLDETGSAAYLDCLYGAEDVYHDCVQANQDCSDQTSTESCDADYATNVQQCSLPSAVQEAATACFPS